MTQNGLIEFADKVDEYMRSIFNDHLHAHDNEILKGKVTMPQFIIMDYLLRKGESNMTELARYMHVTTAAMTGMVERLVRDRSVERVYDSGDRRVVKVHLTPGGQQLVKKINAQRRRMIIRMFGKLSGTDRSTYLAILAKIKQAMAG